MTLHAVADTRPPTRLPRPTRVAVCVPVRGDAAVLGVLLDSLRAVRYPAGLLRVVVAVDGPDPAVERAARHRDATTVVLPETRGSYTARNAAVDRVPDDTDVVLFTDADAMVPPHWVAAHLRTLSRAHVSGGAVRFLLPDRPTPAQWVDACRHLDQRHFVERLGFAATVNVAVRTEVLREVRFDGTLRSGGDADFGRRARAAGYSIAYADDAWVGHMPRGTRTDLLRKVDRLARGAALLETRGERAAERRAPGRPRPVARARRHGVGGPAWRAEVLTLDALCSLVYAARVPSVVWPALRRRLPVLSARR